MSETNDIYHCPDCGDVLLSMCPTCSRPDRKVYDAAMAAHDLDLFQLAVDNLGDDYLSPSSVLFVRLRDSCRRAKEGR